VVKNKVAPPFKQAEFDIIYGTGISWEGTVLDSALEKKIVQKSGSHFSFEDERLGQGRQNATAFLREHPDVGQQILARLQASIGPEQVVSARLLPEHEAPKAESDAKAGSNGAGAEAEAEAEAEAPAKVASKA
jgi:recombination protein RecA